MTNNMNELEIAITESLQRRGILNQIQASLRGSIYTSISCPTPQLQPQVNPENKIINWLINEYLEFNGYVCTKSVLNKEISSSISSSYCRDDIERILGVTTKGNDTIEKLPLLYSILFQHSPNGMMNTNTDNTHTSP